MSYTITAQDRSQWDKESSQQPQKKPSSPGFNEKQWIKEKKADFFPRLTHENVASGKAPSPHGSLYNYGAGIGDDFINIANIPHDVGITSIPRIHNFTQVGGLPYELGQATGYLVPGAAGEGLASMAGKGIGALVGGTKMGAKALDVAEDYPRIAKLTSGAGSVARSAGVGAGVGAATSPTSERESGAIGGAIGGSAGEAIGGALNPFKRTPEKVLAKSLYPLSEFLHSRLKGIIGHDTGEDAIKEAYQTAERKANNWSKPENNAYTLHKQNATYVNKPFEDELGRINDELMANDNEMIAKNPNINRDKVHRQVNRVGGNINFANLLPRRQNINKLANWNKDLSGDENDLLKHYSNRLSGALDKGIEWSKTFNGGNPRHAELLDQLEKNWADQRNNYAKWKQFFVNPKTQQYSKNLEQNYKDGEWQKILDQYALDKNEGSDAMKTTFKVKHLNDLLGSPDKAKAILLQRSLGISPDGINIRKLHDQFVNKQISPHILNNVLDDNDKRVFHLITSARIANDQLKKRPVLSKREALKLGGIVLGSHMLGHLSVPASVGMGGAYLASRMGADALSSRSALRQARRLVKKGDMKALYKTMKPIKRALSGPTFPVRVAAPIGGAIGTTIADK